MGAFAARQVVLLPFPFSDLTRSKFRPAAVLAEVDRGDWVLCQITSNPYADPRAIEMAQSDFATGGLRRTSYARPGKLFTAHETFFNTVLGELTQAAHGSIVGSVIGLLRAATG